MNQAQLPVVLACLRGGSSHPVPTGRRAHVLAQPNPNCRQAYPNRHVPIRTQRP
jgi:hypothetical protein